MKENININLSSAAFNNSFLCESLNDLEEVAELILNCHNEKRIFAFYGEMGAGKTTLIQRLCNQLKVSDVVSSPTFALINEYHSDDLDRVFHFDFYRLEKLEEAYDLGYEDYFYSGDYCFIEWPGKIDGLLPEETVFIEIKVNQDTDLRTIYF